MSPIQQAISNRRKRFVIVAGVLFGAFWLFLVWYMLSGNDSNLPLENQPGVVAVQPASPTANPYLPSTYKAPVNILHHHVSVSTPSASHSYSSSMSNSSAGLRAYTTSNAQLHSIGGGGSGSGSAGSGGHGSGSRGIKVTSVSYSGAIYVPIVSNAITSVGAQDAGEVVDQKMGITARRSPMDNSRPRKVDHEDEWWLDEQPVGDVAWPLMLLLTIVWCGRVRLRKQQ